MEEAPQIREEIIEKFKSQLDLPKHKPSTPFILAPVGLIGSGKTTIVRKLAKELGLVFVSGDELRALYVEKGLNYAGLIIETELSIVKSLLKSGYSVSIDNDCAGYVGQDLNKRREEVDVPIIWIHINTSEEQCIGNIKKRGTTIFGANTERMLETYRIRKKKFHTKPHDTEFTCVFSGEHKKTDIEIDECLQIIKALAK